VDAAEPRQVGQGMRPAEQDGDERPRGEKEHPKEHPGDEDGERLLDAHLPPLGPIGEPHRGNGADQTAGNAPEQAMGPGRVRLPQVEADPDQNQRVDRENAEGSSQHSVLRGAVRLRGAGEECIFPGSMATAPIVKTIPRPEKRTLGPQIFVSLEQIERARELAWKITASAMAFIERHTTVATERAVLRFFGISGVGGGGVPLANVMVDRLHRAGVLSRGAAYWMGRAMRLGGRSPAEMIERLVALPDEELRRPLPAEEEAAIREEMRVEAHQALDELARRIEARKALASELAEKSSEAGPLKY